MPWLTAHCCCTGGNESHKLGIFLAHNGNKKKPSSEASSSLRTSVLGKLPTHNKPIPWVHSKRFKENYQLGKILGSGAFSVVHEAYRRCENQVDVNGTDNHKNNNSTYAVKVVQRYKMSSKQLLALKDEVQVLADLQHDQIIRLHEIYKEPRCFFVVMEKLDGGELFDRLCQKSSYSEQIARNLCRIMFEAISYCHSQQVTHRDLKPENLLLKNATDDANIKIADFGFAKRVLRPNSLTTRCGSPVYTAPEIINFKLYDERVDNWSLGVIVYCLLGGYPPFYANTVKEIFQQIRQGTYTFHAEHWNGISPDAKKFIKQLLTLDPVHRMTSREALEHSWMTGRGDNLGQVHLASNIQRLKEYNQQRKRNSGPVKSTNFYWLVSRR